MLGLTSLFTDVSSEMVATILPLYLVYSLGLSPLQFGVVDGLHNGASALVRLAAGMVGDRTRRHKEVAAAGYGLSAVCKLGLLAVGNAFSALSAIVFLDRTGKGIRTAPRDALISLSVDRKDLGAAFGVHRALGSGRSWRSGCSRSLRTRSTPCSSSASASRWSGSASSCSSSRTGRARPPSATSSGSRCARPSDCSPSARSRSSSAWPACSHSSR